MTKPNLTCFCCGVKLELYEEMQPISGVHFRSYGNYGSTIFDTCGSGEYLDIAICDVCVAYRHDRLRGSGAEGITKNHYEKKMQALRKYM